MKSKELSLLPEPSGSGSSSKKFAILMATYCGQHYLHDQLNSFAAQTPPHWEGWASDDGSIDNTHQILEQCREAWGPQRLSIHHGPREGFAAHLCIAGDQIGVVAHDWWA